MSNKNLQPKDFELETSTVWSFRHRGKWATHSSKFRGNWAPQVVRNILLRYSEEGDYIIDPMVGSGTTLIEAKLTGRNSLGVDINHEAIEITKKALEFDGTNSVKCKVKLGDARKLDFLEDESVDLITLHPPYANMVEYSHKEIDEDLSSIEDIEEFYSEMGVVAKELHRILKPNKYCAVLMGDTRKNKHYIPLAFNVMQEFLKVGFVIKENVIKHQWNTKTHGFWAKRSKKYNFLLILHENLFIFRKLGKNESAEKIKYSKYHSS